MKSRVAKFLALGVVGAGVAIGIGYVRMAADARADLITSANEAVYRQIRSRSPRSELRHADIAVDDFVVERGVTNGVAFHVRVRITRRPFEPTLNSSGFTLNPTETEEFIVTGVGYNTTVPLNDLVPFLKRPSYQCDSVSMSLPEERLWPSSRADKLWEESRGQEENAVFDAWIQMAFREERRPTEAEPILALMVARKFRSEGRFADALTLLQKFPVPLGEAVPIWRERYEQEKALATAKSTK
jgi:hypothetical protein